MSTTGMRPPLDRDAAAESALRAATDALGGDGFGLLLVDYQGTMELAAAVRRAHGIATRSTDAENVPDPLPRPGNQARS